VEANYSLPPKPALGYQKQPSPFYSDSANGTTEQAQSHARGGGGVSAAAPSVVTVGRLMNEYSPQPSPRAMAALATGGVNSRIRGAVLAGNSSVNLVGSGDSGASSAVDVSTVSLRLQRAPPPATVEIIRGRRPSWEISDDIEDEGEALSASVRGDDGNEKRRRDARRTRSIAATSSDNAPPQQQFEAAPPISIKKSIRIIQQQQQQQYSQMPQQQSSSSSDQLDVNSINATSRRETPVQQQQPPKSGIVVSADPSALAIGRSGKQSASINMNRPLVEQTSTNKLLLPGSSDKNAPGQFAIGIPLAGKQTRDLAKERDRLQV
jgi:hypothetical protein